MEAHMARDIRQIISQLTLEEKAGLCSGLDFWQTKAVERLGIPSIVMTDGPNGLRKSRVTSGFPDEKNSVPATCFPSGATLASSWDRTLIEKVGVALGEECQAEGVSIILGPSANIKRSPLCGRNFEYFSEDPFLSSEMAAHHILGVQSQGVGTSLKHFAVNNQEHRRMSVDAIVDERTLREIYLASFEGAVKQAQPWTVMCAYNKLNGTYCSQLKVLLSDILKDEWGHTGFVVSDWGAVDERVAGLEAGLELEMPNSGGTNDQKIIEAVNTGYLSEAVLDNAVERLLKIILSAVDQHKAQATYDQAVHHRLAREIARECMVLLKNEANLLPLKKEGSLAVIGAFANHPRYQGSGAAHLNPTQLDNILDEIKTAAGSQVEILYADGYALDHDTVDEGLLREAVETASRAKVAVIFAGLPHSYESEGFDRTHIDMPDNHLKLIEAVTQVQSKVVVVLSNGAPIAMPWLAQVQAVLEAYLGGQALGGAIADLLFGVSNPCGKLAETFPMQLSHNPSYLNFPGEGDRVEYREGLFVGYRYYEKKDIQPLFPFGFGLSYTTFAYLAISVDKKEIADNDTITVRVNVKNTGALPGKEIVQVYVRDVASSVIRPLKELKGFEKVDLQPGEEKIVTFTLGKRAFAYYNITLKDWHVESGDFEILVGSSSDAILLKETVRVNSTVTFKKVFHRNSTLGDILSDPIASNIVKPLFDQFAGLSGIPLDALGIDIQAMMMNMPLRAMVTFSGGAMNDEILTGLLAYINANMP